MTMQLRSWHQRCETFLKRTNHSPFCQSPTLNYSDLNSCNFNLISETLPVFFFVQGVPYLKATTSPRMCGTYSSICVRAHLNVMFVDSLRLCWYLSKCYFSLLSRTLLSYFPPDCLIGVVTGGNVISQGSNYTDGAVDDENSVSRTQWTSWGGI